MLTQALLMSVQLIEALLMSVQLTEALLMSVQLTEALLMSVQLTEALLMSVQLTEAIEALDPEHKCGEYWHGKADREAAAAGLPPVERGPRPPRPSGGAAPRLKRARKPRFVFSMMFHHLRSSTANRTHCLPDA